MGYSFCMKLIIPQYPLVFYAKFCLKCIQVNWSFAFIMRQNLVKLEQSPSHEDKSKFQKLNTNCYKVCSLGCRYEMESYPKTLRGFSLTHCMHINFFYSSKKYFSPFYFFYVYMHTRMLVPVAYVCPWDMRVLFSGVSDLLPLCGSQDGNWGIGLQAGASALWAIL